jgi:hypothetical protein
MAPILFVCLCLFLGVVLPMILRDQAGDAESRQTGDSAEELSPIGSSDLEASTTLSTPPESITSFATLSLSEWETPGDWSTSSDGESSSWD